MRVAACRISGNGDGNGLQITLLLPMVRVGMVLSSLDTTIVTNWKLVGQREGITEYSSKGFPAYSPEGKINSQDTRESGVLACFCTRNTPGNV